MIARKTYCHIQDTVYHVMFNWHYEKCVSPSYAKLINSPKRYQNE